ncbi:hypothetical protein GCM10010266_64490 [Streptomyces griseomycini]|nr:hypothetical protein GCM10010266_64490 [Streptomyces griseomycini]GGR48708.1 hypothetical protein GCM10015536_63100 [Streptomyces griseomycini]
MQLHYPEGPAPPPAQVPHNDPPAYPRPAHKKIALDPAESSAIDDAPLFSCPESSDLLGRGACWGSPRVAWS